MKTLSDLIPEHQKTETRVCDEHGEYTSTNYLGAHWSGCAQCNEIQKIEREAKEKAQAEREEAERAARSWRIKIGHAQIPERFQDRTLNSYIAKNHGQEKALAFAKDYADNFDEIRKIGRSVIFVGKPGTGKTHLAVGIALQIMVKHTVLFTTVQRAIRRVKDTWTKGSEESETDAINSIAFPDLLIMDEVGVQFGSEFERQVMFDILNERYEKRKPSILLSNIAPGELGPYLGDRVTDRLREDGGKMIAFDWESYRRNPIQGETK
jgi:DNA replication protein DnaC